MDRRGSRLERALVLPESRAAAAARRSANPAWAKNEIDYFILRELDREKLKPSPEADKATLIRRLSFDLTGLPPTIAEIDAFMADSRATAYERLVDRLLASPHYGERMAIKWLDLARYADTNGYHVDDHRNIWKFREWVIDAFNRNMPFDRFTIEQIAGDLLPNPTIEQRIASGFHRNVMVTSEGGADPEEYLTKYANDRVTTTATVWLGTTLACAECHDHKYDPFTQRDFYRLYAYFNNIPELGLDTRQGSPVPNLQIPTAEQAAQLATYRRQIAELEARIKQEVAQVTIDPPSPHFAPERAAGICVARRRAAAAGLGRRLGGRGFVALGRVAAAGAQRPAVQRADRQRLWPALLHQLERPAHDRRGRQAVCPRLSRSAQSAAGDHAAVQRRQLGASRLLGCRT